MGILRISVMVCTVMPVSSALAAPSNDNIRASLAPPTARVDMVLDSDTYNEVDDQFALAYALHSADRIDMKAVHAAPFKNDRSSSPGDGMERSYHEILRVLKVLGRSSDTFVFRGSSRFLEDRRTPVDSPAARNLIRLAHADRRGPLYVVGLGAATNIASALLTDPTITSRIVVIWIGGHPYTWPHARDFNLKQDIPAAQVLFDSRVPLVHVPAGDVAAALEITLPELEAGLKDRSPVADSLLGNVESYFSAKQAQHKRPRSGENAWQKVIWDIATIAWLAEPECLVSSRIQSSPVLTDAETWEQDTERHPVRVAVNLDRKRIFTDLFGKLGRPYLPSQVVARVTFDFSTHRRLAPGSDNWPVTWADDGHQYTAWGDGGGFDGTNSEGRVTLGIARIEGDSRTYTGTNVWGGYRTENTTQFSGKSYGILSVDGTLYMWVVPQPNPHLRECRIACSTNRGASWRRADWAFRFEDGLSIPTFLNFGRDYAGARDDYVYSYLIGPRWGPEEARTRYGFDVHRPGRIHLSRVPGDAIMQRDRHEFFAGLDASGKPRWTAALQEKQPVFRDSNGVGWNVSVSYNAGLGRYLLATEHGETHSGRFGVFDAPEPWGPWTTVAYDDDWGAGDVEVSTFHWVFPTKWIEEDGTRFTMVFTGKRSNDSWNTVAGRFIPRAAR